MTFFIRTKNILYGLYKKYWKQGHPRSRNLKKNIGASFVIKAISIVLSLIKVPILLNYLNPDKYGLWLTIASILEWMAIFDLGLGHGFRNRFAESIAMGDNRRAKGLVSTAYLSMIVIMLTVFLLFIPAILFVNWRSILNTDLISNNELRVTIFMVAAVFVGRFVLQLISVMLKALQKPALADVFLPISSILSLAIILIIKYFVNDSLFWASLAIAVPPVLVLLIANILIFSGRYKQFRPSVRAYNKHYISDIYSLGWKFFVGQITGLVLFSSANIILLRAVNAHEVTVYNIANKYFSLPISYFMIIVTPYWSAVTDAYYRNEMEWIKRNMNKIMKVAALFCFLLLAMLGLSKFAFHYWIKDRVHIPFSLSLSLTLYNITVVFMAPYSMFLNGFGKLKLATRVTLIKTITYLPLAWFFAKNWSSVGLILALFIANMIPNILISIKQYSLIVNNKATGIWDE